MWQLEEAWWSARLLVCVCLLAVATPFILAGSAFHTGPFWTTAAGHYGAILHLCGFGDESGGMFSG